MTIEAQRLWWIGLVVVLGVAWLAAGNPGTAESTAQDAPAASDSVRVEHELVRAGIVRETPPPAVRRARFAPPASRRASRVAEKPSPTITARAMRILIGDGRHRPQPFPTVK
jgi:hypothetical protein